MEKIKRLLILLAIIILIVVATSLAVQFADKPRDFNGELLDIAGMIDGELAFKHVEVLAGDYYEGRFAGTAKTNEAAHYIAGKFHEYGLEPFGNNGTYFETFNVDYWLASNWSLEVLTPEGIAGNYDSNPIEYCAPGNITEKLVYVGWGDSESDYAGKNVAGKIAFVLRGPSLTWYPVAVAYNHGATGVIIFDHTSTPEPFQGTLLEPRDIPVVSLAQEDGKKILEAMNFTVITDNSLDPTDISGSQSYFPTAQLYVDAEMGKDQPTQNVLGIINGTEPGEYVLICGHYDHIGYSKGEIYNGANDNAAGVAVVLELARVLPTYAEVHPPRRSIIFAAWTAEERGLLGSKYFVDNHQELLIHISVVFNLDMPGAGGWVDGAPRNNMYIGNASRARWASGFVYNVSQFLIHEGQIVLGADALPYYEKTGEYALYAGVDDIIAIEDAGGSDHVSFLEAGVPATIICSHAREASNYPEYHKQRDDTELIDLVKLEISGKMVGCSAWKVAQYAT